MLSIVAEASPIIDEATRSVGSFLIELALVAIAAIVGVIARKGHKLVQKVHAQLVPNGGSSVRDSLDRIEDRLSFADARAKVLLGASNVALLEADPDGLLVTASPAFLALTGRVSDDLLGNGWMETVNSNERPDVVVDWRSAIEHRRAFDRTFGVTRLDGSIVRVRVRCKPVHGSEPRKKLIGYLGTLIPVETH